MLITTFLRPLPSLIKCRLSFMIEMGLFQQHLKKEWRIEMGVHPVLFLVRKGMGLFQKVQLNGGSFLDFRFSASYLRCIAAKYSFFFSLLQNWQDCLVSWGFILKQWHHFTTTFSRWFIILREILDRQQWCIKFPANFFILSYSRSILLLLLCKVWVSIIF